MPRSSTELSVLLPGLFGRLALWRRDYGYSAQPAALGSVLTRADAETIAAADFEQTLCRLFLLEPSPNADPPLAALSYLHDSGGRPPPGFCLRADPVHLTAGVDELILQDTDLDITLEEARALAGEVEAFFAESAWRVEVLHPRRWYLHLPDAEALHTHSPEQALGRDVREHLPRGERTRFWHNSLNEVQMLLHASPVNAARETEGRARINSLWLWGAGCLPGLPAPTWSQVWGVSPVVRGLARATDTANAEPPVDARAWLAQQRGGSQLLVLDALRPWAARDDIESWRAALEAIEADWIEPLFEALKRGRLDRLHLYTCDGRRFSLGRSAARWRVWRGSRALHGWEISP